MRKAFIVSLLLVFSFVLAACSSEQTVTTMQAEEGGAIIKITLKAEGDRVVEQTADNEISYDALGISSAEEAEEIFAQFTAEFENIEGITHNISYEEDRVVESLTIDYDKVNMDEASSLTGFQYEGDTSEDVSLEGTIEMLESQGFAEVE